MNTISVKSRWLRVMAAWSVLLGGILCAADVPWAWDDGTHPQDETVSKTAVVSGEFDFVANSVTAAAVVSEAVDTWGVWSILMDGLDFNTRPCMTFLILR